MEEDLYFEKELLKSYEKQIHITKRGIFWEKAYIGLCIINVISFLANTYKYYNDNKWSSLFFLLSSFMWIILIYFTNKNIKKQKILLTECLQSHDKQLQIVDYPKYLKTQRTKKLNKIKKRLF